MRRRLLLLAFFAAAPACADPVPDPPPDSRPVVVATIHPIASVVRAVAGGAVAVRTLLPAGANPDTYETRPRDAEALAAADLLVRVGGAVDAWVGETPVPRQVEFTEGLRLEAEGGHGTGNPHVWLDPLRVRDHLLPRLTEALVQTVPDSAEAIQSRSAAYADSLTALDAEIRALLANAPTDRFMAAHAAWVYFAQRYDLVFAGALHSSPGRELGSRELARLVEEAEAMGVRAVLAEPQLGRAGVDALAGELEARVEVADPIGGPGMEGREDYLSLMRFNARAFARALGAMP